MRSWALARSSLKRLSFKLQRRVEYRRQGVLTAGIEGWGGVLKGGEGLVLPEALGQVLGGLRVKLVLSEAAHKGKTRVLAAADTFERK